MKSAKKSLQGLLLWFVCLALKLAAAEGTRSSDPHVIQPEVFPDIDLSKVIEIPLGEPDTVHNDIPGEPLNPNDFQTAYLMSHPPIDTYKQKDPIEIAGLFEGDIMLHGSEPHMQTNATRGGFRNAIIKNDRRWPNGVIPYVISSTYSDAERGAIAMAFKNFQEQTCIKFAPRTVTDKDYIHLLKGDGCSSSVGRIGGAQAVSLSPGCIFVGIIMHELMHAAGFWHEQSRSDRDTYITINWGNIQKGMRFNFETYDWNTMQSLGMSYDMGSIMHYGPYAFAKNRDQPTIIPNNGGEIGQRRGFSTTDIAKLNRLYNCDNATQSLEEIQPVSNPEPPPLPPAVTNCEDSHVHCALWASEGECKRNPAWMQVNCIKSCQQCGNECQNFSTYCPYWSELGECEKNKAYMHVFCKRACGICGAAGKDQMDQWTAPARVDPAIPGQPKDIAS